MGNKPYHKYIFDEKNRKLSDEIINNAKYAAFFGNKFPNGLKLFFSTLTKFCNYIQFKICL